MTANDPGSVPPWISGEFDIAGLLRGTPRLLTRDQFIDHLERQTQVTRKSIDWRFAVFMVNIEALGALHALQGSKAAEELARAAATLVGTRLNPLDAVAVMRDGCFAVLVEIPLLSMSMGDFAELIQHDCMSLIRERNAELDAAVSIGVAKVGRSYLLASDVIRDAGIALRHAREEKPGSIVAYNRSMEMAPAIAT